MNWVIEVKLFPGCCVWVGLVAVWALSGWSTENIETGGSVHRFCFLNMVFRHKKRTRSDGWPYTPLGITAKSAILAKMDLADFAVTRWALKFWKARLDIESWGILLFWVGIEKEIIHFCPKSSDTAATLRCKMIYYFEVEFCTPPWSDDAYSDPVKCTR